MRHDQERFKYLSTLFNKNEAIKHIMMLENKIAENKSFPHEAVVKPQITEEKEQNNHNLDIIHYGVCTKCGGLDLYLVDCINWKKSKSE